MADAGPGRPVWALGLMSGTSMDGVDAALLLTDGEEIAAEGPSAFSPAEPAACPALLRLAAEPARYLSPGSEEDRAAREAAEAEVVRLHARAAVDLLAAAEVQPDLVAFPGQTLLHAPEERRTWQIGRGAALARALNRPVVWDFRTADVAAGGEGAPLAPFFHFALAKRLGLAEPVAFLNIGGVANVTWVDPAAPAPEAPGALLAFDTGPGNALLDDWARARAGLPADLDGRLAAAGNPRAAELRSNRLADHLRRPPPKSLDRNAFAEILARLDGLSAEDGAAVLTALTADCAAAAAEHLPRPPARWLVCGGGRRNPALMAALAERLAAPVAPVEAVGLDGDMLEAQAFAHLAVRVLRGLPTSAPGTTGCPRPVSGGRLARP